MNWLAGKLTAQAVQGIAAALLVLSIGLGVQVWVQAKRIDTFKAQAETALAQKSAAITERDSWKSKTADALAANRAYDTAFDQLQAAAAEKQRLADAAAQQAAAAVAAAQRDEAKAERELGEYRRVFGARPKDCDAALLALDRVCPTLRSY